MTGIETLALIVALCGNPGDYSPCVHQTLDCVRKMKMPSKVQAIRACVKYQPVNPNKMRKLKWK